MGKVKIHEIAKKLGVASKEVITMANNIGINVTSHLSSVEEEQEKKILQQFNKNTQNPKQEKEKDKTKQDKVKEDKKTETPVIIRREVIINDNNKNKNRKK